MSNRMTYSISHVTPTHTITFHNVQRLNKIAAVGHAKNANHRAIDRVERLHERGVSKDSPAYIAARAELRETAAAYLDAVEAARE